MTPSALAGWSSTERLSPDGAVQLEQRVHSVRPLVELSRRGALELGDRYWAEVERFTHRLVRARRRDGGIELRLLGRWTLLRFGAPEVVVGEAGVLSRFAIAGGMLARRPAGSITFAQEVRPAMQLRATVDGFFPRLAGKPGSPLGTGALYRHVQRRVHTNVSRRYFRRLIAEAGS